MADIGIFLAPACAMLRHIFRKRAAAVGGDRVMRRPILLRQRSGDAPDTGTQRLRRKDFGIGAEA